jgi:rhodanese-related sulfurtransferase
MRRLYIPNRDVIFVFWLFGSLLFGFPLNALAQSESGYTVMPVLEMKKMLDSGTEILVVDTLSHSAYTREHIPKAKNFEFPNETMDQWNKRKMGGKTQNDFMAFLGENKDKPVIFYCLDEK